MVGTHLTRGDAGLGFPSHHLDVRVGYAVRDLLTRVRPEVVVHTAYRQDDWATTAGGAAQVALATHDVGARLVHVSSDVVFSGRSASYAESAEPDPVSPYGEAKVAAEAAVLEVVGDAVVARTSLVLGPSAGRPSPMERLVHDLAAGRVDAALFTDDVRCAVHVSDLAAALLELALSDARGIRHLGGRDAVSRHEIALLVAARDGLDPARFRTALRAESGLPGPVDLRLDSTWTQGTLATRLRGAREFLTS